MILQKSNPKALNLDGIDKLNKKVTVGFKCDPKIKLRLAHQAGKVGLTLSEYIENLLLDLENAKKNSESEIERLKEQLDFYENNILLSFFKEHEGQSVKFNDANQVEMNVEIKEPKDMYTIIINSFRTKI